MARRRYRMKMVLLKNVTVQSVIDWLQDNVSLMLQKPKDPKFIPFAIGNDWHVFVYKEQVEIWLPDEAAAMLVLRFAE